MYVIYIIILSLYYIYYIYHRNPEDSIEKRNIGKILNQKQNMKTIQIWGKPWTKRRTWKTNIWEENKSKKNSDPKQTNKKEKKMAKRCIEKTKIG